MAQVLASLHAVTSEPLFLEYGVYDNTAALFCRARRSVAKIIERQLAAAYPELEVERIHEGATTPPPGKLIKTAELRLVADVMPIETCDAFEDRIGRELNDPIAGLLGLLAAGPELSVRSHVAIEITPTRRNRYRTARRVLNRYYKTKLHEHHRRGTAYLVWATSPSRFRRAVARFLAAAVYRRQSLPPIESTTAYSRLDHPLYTVRIYLMAAADSEYAAQHQLDQLAAGFSPFTHNTPAHFRAVRHGKNRRGSLFSVEELAILFHPATSTVKTERMEQVSSRRFEPPAVLPAAKEPDAVTLGTADFRRRHELIALRADDRRRHLYCVGKTGVGKSTLLLNLITDDIQKQRGVGVIDPHGDLIADVLQRIPKARTKDVILFDPAEHPIAFNPLACSRPEQRSLVAAGVLSAMKKVFAVDETNAPRMLYILRNVLVALVEQPQSTLLDVPRMLTEQAFRRQVVGRVSDPLIHSFWQNEFANWNDRYRDEAIAPIQNKVGQFLTSPLIRHVFASPKNALDLRRIMDDGKVLLINLSHGRLGEDSAALLGALLVTSIEQAAKSRADIQEDQRRDYYLYADEFQTYAGTESLGIILSQARKYRLSLCLANQLVDQMDPELASTVFGNVGSLCVMQVGFADAERLAAELGGDVTPQDLAALPKYTALVRMLIDGEPTRPFTIRTLPPPALSGRYADANRLVEVSSRRYASVPT
jgi:hypothetical protein